MNLVEPILWHGRSRPDTIALVDNDRTITYRELAELVSRTAGHLRALGVRRGDYIGLCLKNDWRHIVALLAVARLGAIFVQIDPRARQAEKARIAAVFNYKLVLSLQDADVNANYTTVVLDAAWDRGVAQAEAPSSLPDEWHDPMAVQSTAGTTGLSKFTVATHLQFYFRTANFCEIMPPIRHHRYLATLPLFYAYGRNLCLLHLLHGATLIFFPNLFRPADFVEAVTKHQATIAALVPSNVRQLLSAAGDAEPLLPGLELLLSAGAPLFSDEKRETLRQLTPHFYEVYAASAFGPISVLRPQDMLKSGDTVGRPFPLVSVEIVDEENRPVTHGETGRLRCGGPALAPPIPGQSVDDFREGWHYPGELAAFDDCGYIHIRGRTSEVVFRAGLKIFPTEIEAVLQTHEKVADAAVVAHATGNEADLAAYVVIKEEITPGQLLAHCRQRLTPYKVPQQIHIVPELPRNASGKVDKRALANRSEGVTP
jgi:acyl-coenzyme A synthetase/AMP-(fatty) acid ligase